MYLDTKENAEVASGAGIPFENDLTEKLDLALRMSEQERQERRRKASDQVLRDYSWDAVTRQFDDLIVGLATAPEVVGG